MMLLRPILASILSHNPSSLEKLAIRWGDGLSSLFCVDDRQGARNGIEDLLPDIMSALPSLKFIACPARII